MDPNLTKILARGVEVHSEILVKFFPSSHPLTRGKWAITEIFSLNTGKDPEDRIFSRYQIEEFFKSNRTIPHYASDEIGKHLANQFINESLEYGIIEETGNDNYRLKINGKKLDTVISNYKKLYLERAAERLATEIAMKKIVEEFKKYKRLF